MGTGSRLKINTRDKYEAPEVRLIRTVGFYELTQGNGNIQCSADTNNNNTYNNNINNFSNVETRKQDRSGLFVAHPRSEPKVTSINLYERVGRRPSRTQEMAAR